MKVYAQRLTGHTLVAEGAAFTPEGERITWNTTGGRGYGMCSCGTVSPEELPSGIKRADWHRAHKEAVREQIRQVNRDRFRGQGH